AVITNIPSKFRFGFSASKSGAKVEILKLTEKESATYNPRTSDMWIPYGAGGSAGASAWTISKRSEIAYSFTYARWNQNRGLTAIVDKLITQGIWRVGLIIRGAWAPNTKWQPVIGICKDGWAKDGATALGKDEDTIGYYSQGVTTQAGRMLQGNKEWKDGDRLDVELDMRERIVYFFVKGRQGHVVYTNVPPQVRVGVSLSAAGATAQVALLSDVKCSFQPRATDWWEPWGGVNVPNKTSLFKVPKIPDKIVISQMMAHFNDAVKYTTMVDFIVQTGSQGLHLDFKFYDTCGGEFSPVVGIAPSPWVNEDKGIVIGKDNHSAGFDADGNVICKNDKGKAGNDKWKDGQVIGIEVDIKNNRVWFFVNGTKQKVYLANIPPLVQIGLSLCKKGGTIEVVRATKFDDSQYKVETGDIQVNM
ncbi:MAG: hypothetical protein EZS28_033234, partial [Streblomastix strix]